MSDTKQPSPGAPPGGDPASAPAAAATPPADTPPAPKAAPAPAAAKPAPPRTEAPSLPPDKMFSAQLRSLLQTLLKSGEPATIEVGKTAFTGRIFRLMLAEGWLAMEHADGRRRAFMLIEGGRIRSRSGQEMSLPGGAH